MIWSILYFIAGLAAGRALNLLISRISLDFQTQSQLSDASIDKSFETPLWYIPLISYLLQLFKSESNTPKLSARSAIIEALTAGLWLWAFSQYNTGEGLLFVIMTAVLTVITLIDMQTMFIPLSMILTGLGSLVVYHVIIPGQLSSALWGVVAGLGYLGGMMLLTSLLFRKQTMGFGDLQLIVVLGAWLGVMNILATVLCGAVLALLVWISLSYKDGFDRNRPIPFGPFLSMAGVAIYMLNPDWESLLHLWL